MKKSEAYHRKPDPGPEVVAKPIFDRDLDPFEVAKIRRMWRKGVTAFAIATQLRLRYARIQTFLDRLEREDLHA